jgi:TM2 domain-containing membrane protein YozV
MSADPQQPTEPLPPSLPWAQQPPATPPPSAWAQQPPATPPPTAPHSAWPPPPAQGHGMPGHGGYGHERYQIREQLQPRYREHHEPGWQAHEWAPLPLYGQEMYGTTVAPKSPAVSVLLSVFIPGLGSMVNGNVGVGVAILMLNIVGWILALALIGIPLAIGTWIWGLVDAHQSAQRWNREHGIIS